MPNYNCSNPGGGTCVRPAIFRPAVVLPRCRLYISKNFMDRIISDITGDMMSRLPGERQYYRLEELQSRELPAFLVRRLRLEMERGLRDSLSFPRTDWADLDNREVRESWDRFREAAAEHLRLPAGHARAVMEAAVRDCLKMLVRPRARIPEVLYGSDRELSMKQLEERLEGLVVYPHFRALIPRYMNKKGMERLTRDRCGEIIRQADEKLAARYTAGEWVTLLDPLFEICGGEVEPALLSLFFEDKNLPNISSRFANREKDINRAGFHDFLRSGETGEPVEEDAEEPAPPPVEAEEKEAEEEEENTINRMFASAREEAAGDEAARETPAEKPAESETETGGEGEDGRDRESAGETEDAADTDSEGKTGSGESAGSGDDAEETPMWMRYLDSEEQENFEREQQELQEYGYPPAWEESEDAGRDEPADGVGEAREPAGPEDDDAVEEGFIDDPIVDLTEPEEDEESGESESARKLREEMEDERSYFAEEIFRGSERAYEEALREIAAYESWKEASRFIEKNIFKRNLVDIYSEPAVDFTDRLHSWFMEHDNSK